MGEMLNRLNAQRAMAEEGVQDEDRRLRDLWIARTPSLARAAVRQIGLQGRYNMSAPWSERVTSIHWRGDQQLAWNVRPLDRFDHPSGIVDDRYIALVETGDVVYVTTKNGRSEIVSYDPDALGFSVEEVGSVYVSIILVVDDRDFKAKNFSSSPTEMLALGPVAT